MLVVIWYNAVSAAILLILSLYLTVSFFRNKIFQALSLFLFAGGVKIACHALVLAPSVDPAQWFIRINCIPPLLFGPLIYLFIRTLTGTALHWKRDVIHLLPGIVYLLYLIPWFLSDTDSRFYPIPYDIEKAIAVVLTFVSGVTYTVLSYEKITQEEKILKRTLFA